MTSSALASMTQSILEASHHRLKGHVRVEAKPRSRRLVYHISKAPGLAVKVEVGGAFLSQPMNIKDRVERIREHSVQILCGERLAEGVRLMEKESGSC